MTTIKQLKSDRNYAQYVGKMSFDELIMEADMLGVGHDEEHWLDDEWPDKEDGLRSDVIDAIGSLDNYLARLKK